MLLRISKEDDALRQRQEELQSELKSLETLLQMKQLDSTVVSCEMIFSLLRKNAIIQQQIVIINLEYSELRNKRQLLDSERQSQLKKRKMWWLKEQKYQRLQSYLMSQKKKLDLRLEESELEEKYHG